MLGDPRQDNKTGKVEELLSFLTNPQPLNHSHAGVQPHAAST